MKGSVEFVILYFMFPSHLRRPIEDILYLKVLMQLHVQESVQGLMLRLIIGKKTVTLQTIQTYIKGYSLRV